MGAIAALLDGHAAPPRPPRGIGQLVPAGSGPLRLQRCRSASDLERALQSRLIEAILLGPRAATQLDLGGLRARYPTIPTAVFGRLRAEDANLLSLWDQWQVAVVLVEGVDDAVAGELVLRHTVSRRRLAVLAEFPRLLRLTERWQLLAWERVALSSGRPPRTAALARMLGVSREHLSRQFGAGGAPTLKRVADLLLVVAALELLANPGYSTPTVARLLGFASASHLHTVVRRVTGLGLAEARGLAPRDILRRFLRTRRAAQPPSRPAA